MRTDDMQTDETLKGEAAMPDRQGPWRLFLLGCLFEGGLGLVACLVGWWCDYWPLETFSFTSVGIIWGILGTIPLLLALVLIDRYPLGPFVPLKRVVRETLLPMFQAFRLWQLLVLAIFAGAGEEILFRGLLQGGMFFWLKTLVAEHTASTTSLVIASLLFGLMHPITRTYAVICMLVGLYLGGIWMFTNNLFVPIFIHALYDFLALVYLLRGAANRQSLRETGAEN
ncbi:MAG TPA: CPBP family intramembrane glutamic endopeptidase [Pirellulales bacterium]|jgi:hypothetical protein|nr:CPBP family intramembrane glutamic endopeptidase [Pirellulales bacterium]